ncbi:MAG: AN1-type zinc finger domain-containing protein [Halobacteriaceae archaeon]
MAGCRVCGAEVSEPVRCAGCEETYCPAHGRPTAHDCPALSDTEAVPAARARPPEDGDTPIQRVWAWLRRRL